MFLLIVPIFSQAQSGIPFIQPKEVLAKAYEYYYAGNYEECVAQVDQLYINDSVFGEALNIKASAFLKLKKFDKTIEICDYALSVKKGNRLYFLTNKGVALLRDEKYTEALGIFNQIIEEYPYNATNYYNISLCYYNLEEYQKAIDCMQTSIAFDPYYAQPHYELGLMCLNENLISQALLCFDTYLMLEPESENSLDVLVLANNMVSSKQETKPKNITISPDDEGFQELDLILNNYAALNSKYKVSNKITIPFVKQNQALMEKLSEFEGGNGFWQKNYVAFYSALYKAGHFNALMYRLISSTTVEKYKKIANKENAKNKAFLGFASDNWLDILGKNNPRYENDKNLQYFYYSSGEVNAIGLNNTVEEYTGDFRFYTKEGKLMSKGKMQNDKYDGYWQFYHNNGALSSEGKYTMDLPEGLHSYYYENGSLKSKSNLLAGKLQGEHFTFNNFGVQNAKYTYVEDKLSGEAVFYHDLGEAYKQYELKYIDGEIEGAVTEYYASGEKSMDVVFQKSKRHGLETIYYRNGQIMSKANYLEGKLHGEYISYYQNGKVKLQGGYTNGNYSGNWKSFYENGIPESDFNYSESGELIGEYKMFGNDGNLVAFFEYKKGNIEKYTFYDKTGSVINSQTKQNGDFNYKGYYPNKNIKSDGTFRNNGNKTGDWKFYNKYGFISSKETFDDNKLVKDEEYYPTGSVNTLTFYTDGNQEGYSFSNFINGTKYSEGYYKDGNLYRLWRYYYPNGTLSEEYYYIDDNREGYQYNYAADGKLFSTDYYEYGSRSKTFFYDTNGTETGMFDYYKNGIQKLFYSDSSVLQEIEYLNGLAHGKAVWYYPDGKIETVGNYFDGDRNGEWLWYNYDGQVISRAQYVYGKAEGTWYNYSDNGKIRTIKNYSDDILNGEYKIFNEAGILTNSSRYYEDELIDTAYYYGESGELQMARIYSTEGLVSYSYPGSDGKLLPFIPINNGSGEVITYYPNGQKSRDMKFLSGEIDSVYLEYYPNGQVSDEGFYRCGYLFNSLKQFYSNGKLKSIGNYINNELTGEYMAYYETGILKEKRNYMNGKMHGLAEFYNENGKLVKRFEYYNDEIRRAEYF